MEYISEWDIPGSIPYISISDIYCTDYPIHTEFVVPAAFCPGKIGLFGGAGVGKTVPRWPRLRRQLVAVNFRLWGKLEP